MIIARHLEPQPARPRAKGPEILTVKFHIYPLKTLHLAGQHINPRAEPSVILATYKSRTILGYSEHLSQTPSLPAQNLHFIITLL